MSYTLTLDRSEFSVTWLPPKKFVGSNVEAGLKIDQSRGKRGLRMLARFLIALCIGIAAILAWQPDSDAAREMIVSSSSQLVWVAPPGAPIAQVATDGIAPAALSPDEQQLKAMSPDFAAMRQSVDELIANQERMEREISRLQETARYILYKMSEPSPRPAPAQAPKHGPRPAPKTTGAGPNAHHAATSSTAVGSSSSPPPVLLTHRDTGHMRARSSAAGPRSSTPVAGPKSSTPAAQLSQALKSAWSKITGIRS